MELTATEVRVLGCLLEKSFTTPDQYPLTSNALTTACNQKTSRDPVVTYTTALVDHTMQLLRDAEWARTVRGSGSRAPKHKHIVGERLGVGDKAQSILAVLCLRGPQSVGELTTRTDRYGTFASSQEVESTLAAMAEREPPLVANVGRSVGQSQDRWLQLIGENAAPDEPAQDGGTGRSGSTRASQSRPVDTELLERIEALEQRVADLEAVIAD